MRQTAMMAEIQIGLAMVLPAGVWAQFAVAQQSISAATPAAAVSTVQPQPALGTAVKVIDDPHSGLRWLLVEDPDHPEGPGRLVALDSHGNGAGVQNRAAKAARTQPVIRAGEQVQVEEHSAVVESSLQAVALESAVRGGLLRVRLRVGGRVVEARALAAGRAALELGGGRP